MATIKDVLTEMLTKPNVVIVDGFPGSGKTFLCEVLCAFILQQPHGYVISNVKLQKWDNERNRPIEAQYKNYLLASTFVGVLDAIAEVLFNDRDAHIVVFLDELQNSLGSADWQGGLAKGFKRWLALLRKFRVTFVGSTPRIEWLVSTLRDEEIGLLSVRLLKDPADLERYAGDFMDEHGLDYKHTVVFDWPAQQIHKRPAHVGVIDELAVPEDIAREKGSVYFDTGAVASLSYGKHPLTGRPVDFANLLALLDAEGIVSYDYPEVLYKYFRLSPGESKLPETAEVRDEGSNDPEPATQPKVPEPPKGRPSTKKGIQEKVDQLIVSGSPFADVQRDTGCSEGFFYRRKAALRKEGKIT